jgi:uncharacterized protein YbgA (DUF1722 family)
MEGSSGFVVSKNNKEGYLIAIYSQEKSLFITYEEKQGYGKVLTRIKDSSQRQITIEYKEKQIEIIRSDANKVIIKIENGEIRFFVTQQKEVD